jgi:uncharacterized protein (DUF983 family)
MRTDILCPECMKKKLLQFGNEDPYCDNCGTEFIKVNENTVKYK